MKRTILICILCTALLFTMTACGKSKEEKEKKEKARQEELQQENEAAANAVISSIESLPEGDELTLKDEPAVDGARAIYDELTDEQKALVSVEMVSKLEEAEQKLGEIKLAEEQRQRNMKTDKAAARETEEVINGIPDNVTLDAEAAVDQARASYNLLTDDQKSYVKKSSLDKLTAAEKTIEKLYEEEEKKAEEEAEKAEKKKEKAQKKAKKAKEKAEKQAKKNKEKAEKKAKKDKKNKNKDEDDDKDEEND